jgi:hypothetical protein
VRQPAARKNVNTDEEVTVLEAITRQQPVKIQHAEKTSYML